MKKAKNILLESTAWIMAALFVLSVAFINDPSWMPLIVCIIAFCWLFCFYIANLDYFVGGVDDE